MADFALERRLKRLGFDAVVGVDEAGRGPLAGPVVTAAAYLNTYQFRARIDDSKKLTAKEREEAFSEIIQKSTFAFSIIDEKIIDALNILVATRICMENAVSSLLGKLRNKKICILVDGNVRLTISDYPVISIPHGDSISKTIACASILAKVSRDRIMSLYDKVWPQYGFLKHKGYPTSLHRDALRQFGPCPVHRLSFSYV
jgi:ribonuclease HII